MSNALAYYPESQLKLVKYYVTSSLAFYTTVKISVKCFCTILMFTGISPESPNVAPLWKVLISIKPFIYSHFYRLYQLLLTLPTFKTFLLALINFYSCKYGILGFHGCKFSLIICIYGLKNLQISTNL
jgi:hypothetical protein